MTETRDLVDSPIAQIGTLDPGFPVALLPVRLETRFRRIGNAGELLVRIYPDAILSDAHEPLLTENEAAAGRDYWKRAWRDVDERDAWTLILGETTAERAAWIVKRTTPVNMHQFGTSIPPSFPNLTLRKAGSHHAPKARGLPDRWIVTAIRGPLVPLSDSEPPYRLQVFSEPVRADLSLTLRISGGDGDDEVVDLSGDGLVVEPSLAWVYQFDEAVTAGMAVRIPLTEQDLAEGFDRLLVAGVRTTASVQAQADELEALLDAHRYTRGLAFVPQGACTNNTADQPSYYPPADPADPAGATSFPVTRGQALAAPGTDGAKVATAFGINTGPVDHIRGADGQEQTRARAMSDAVWPAVLGYCLERVGPPFALLLGTAAPPFTVEEARVWQRNWVIPRGPLPALRVGDVPYGLLPVGAEWTPFSPVQIPVPSLLDLLRFWAGLWSLVAMGIDDEGEDGPGVPHVGRSDDPDRDLVELLGMDASSQSVKVRQAMGPDATWNLTSFAGLDPSASTMARTEVTNPMLESLGASLSDDPPLWVHLKYAMQANDFAGPWVTDEPSSETDGLAEDYVAWLATASPAQLKAQLSLPTPDRPALLYLVLRHALLAEYDQMALKILDAYGLALPEEDSEPELVGILSTDTRTPWERFAMQVPLLTGPATLGAFLADPQSQAPEFAPPGVAEALTWLNEYRASLSALAGVPTAELERLFTETLDLAVHRMDAWVTALAVRRLSAMREQEPEGLYLGCYGWVENLRPDPPVDTVPVVLGNGSTVQARTDSGGYVYAPSMLHGATAAVLRSAHLSRSGTAGEAYAVDLTSRRVRTALGLLDAVRDSQPLGAVLGYRFERGLHEGHPGVELDRFIDAFRALYPQVANKAEGSDDPNVTVAARTVVDGLRLLHAWQQGEIPFGTGELPAGGTLRAAIEDELRQLEDAVDAVSDLLMAESVHQVVKGSAAGAAATLDTLAKGQRPPEPEVATIPRGGTVLHQRVAMLFGDGSPAPGWSTVPASPRAEMTPELNSWIGWMLGPPDGYACIATPEGEGPHTVTLADVGLQPIDLVLTMQATSAEGAHPELDLRVAWVVAGATASDPDVTIDYEHTGSGSTARPMAVAFELAVAIGRMLGFGRALTGADLLPPHLDESWFPDDSDLETRQTGALLGLTGARNALASAVAAADTDAGLVADTPTVLRSALRTAAGFGVPGAFPSSRHAVDEAALQSLLAQGRSVAAELERRHAAAFSAHEAGQTIPSVHEVFGPGMPVIPRFLLAAPEQLAPALATEPDLGSQDPEFEVESWLAQLCRVRPALDAWRDVRMYGRALGRHLPRPRIVHVPLEKLANGAAPRWAALPFLDGAERPPSGLVNLALFGAAPPVAEQRWAGLLLDAWPELLPSAEEDAGVVFHFDAPRAEAPQAVLLAVPPTAAQTWSYDELERILLGTLRLVSMRAVDVLVGAESSLGPSMLFPTTLLAANTANEAVSTSFAGKLVGGPVIAQGGSGQ